jgi:YebC/PmpR family DNA-binding regulatory protein
MSGHSKWANIKNKKATEDHRRGEVFSKIARGIRKAVREGGSDDPDLNSSLRLWLDRAKEANMPKDNTKRAIEAGLGEGETGSLQEVVYEGFGPQGVGFLVSCSTDNKNRTTAEVRFAFSRAEGSLGSPGSVKYMFSRDEAGEYHCTIPLEAQNEVHQQQLTKLAESLLELEDVENIFCAVSAITADE